MWCLWSDDSLSVVVRAGTIKLHFCDNLLMGMIDLVNGARLFCHPKRATRMNFIQRVHKKFKNCDIHFQEDSMENGIKENCFD